jgi:hypothetical protein
LLEFEHFPLPLIVTSSPAFDPAYNSGDPQGMSETFRLASGRVDRVNLPTLPLLGAINRGDEEAEKKSINS